MATIADVLVKTLQSVGVERVYGIVGDSLNGITDSIRRNKNIEWVHTRNEEAAAFAAGADAQLTGELAVCAGSCGPGNTHLINGLYDCQRSYAPVLAIAAHIPTPEIGSNYFQETHPNILFKECSHYCEVISSAEQMPRVLATAIQTAISKRGVAVIVISGDLALQETKQKPASWPRAALPQITPNKQELKQLAEILNKSSKTTILAGAGCAGAHDELLALCEQIKAPVVHSLRGKEHVEYDNPYDVGMTGLIGFSSGYFAMAACDTLLILGSSFPYRQFYPNKAKIIQVDVRGEHLGLRAELDLGVVGDVKATIEALLPLLKMQKDKSHLNKATEHYQKSRKKLDALAVGKPGKLPIHPQYLAKCIDESANDDAVFSCDVGTPTLWAARYLKMNGERRLLGSFNHGSMANALSQAIGAQKAYPDRQVVAMCGDGGFAMLMGEIITLIQEKLPVKIVIFNNGLLGFVDMELKASGLLSYGVDLNNPNFADMAKAIGIHSQRVVDPADLSTALENAFAHDGPALIDVVVNKSELAMPPTITVEQMKGFTLFMLKALINNEGEEVINLAKTNLWR